MKQILVTRPVEDFKRTADNLAGLGFEALSAPMMDFKILSFVLPVFDKLSALVFTSANGIRAIAAHEEFKQLPCYVVGMQTAKLAMEQGFEILAQGGGDVNSLCDVIEQDYKKRGLNQGLLHISGVHKAGNLAQKLAELSIANDGLQAYEMRKISDIAIEIQQKIVKQNIGGMLFYSARSAKIFIDMAKKLQLLDEISMIPAFCLSKNIAEVECKPYLKHTYFVDQPDEPALLELMRLKLNSDAVT